jgi:hypothetical protein
MNCVSVVVVYFLFLSFSENKMSAASIAAQVGKLKDELDELISAECLYCGEMMVTSVSQPFFDERDTAEIKSWQI